MLYEYNTTLERDTDIIFRQYEINVERTKLEMNEDAELLNLFSEAEDLGFKVNPRESKSNKINPVNTGKKRNAIQKICAYIVNLITDVISTFKNIFTPGKDHINVESYIKSAKGSIELENDIMRVQQQVDEEVRKGRKLVQAISKGTKVDDAVVEKYMDDAAKGIKKYGRTTIATAASYLQFQKATGNLENLKELTKASLNDFKNSVVDPDADVQLSGVFYSMEKWIKEGTHVYRLFGNKIYEEAMRQEKLQNKKSKKGE